MKSKRFVLNALLVLALLALLAFSCWYANQPAFGYVLYAVMSGDKAYYTLRAIDVLFFYVAGPLSIALLAFIVLQLQETLIGPIRIRIVHGAVDAGFGIVVRVGVIVLGEGIL